jgi:hypothetical protein
LIGVSVLCLIVLVYLADGQAARHYPQVSASLRLAALLVLTKMVAGILEAPFRAKRATVYYEDLLGDWLQFGLLGLVAVVLHFVVGLIVAAPLAVAPVALGVYAVFLLVRRAS